LDGDEIVFATIPDQRKLHNIRRDPRVALTLQGNRVNGWGLQEYMVIEGRARIIEGGAAELLQQLARTYLGPDVVFPGIPDPPPWLCHARGNRARPRRWILELKRPRCADNRQDASQSRLMAARYPELRWAN
jgi:hypothetical protein